MSHAFRVSGRVGAVVPLVLAIACSSRPDEQKSLAQKAMEQAKEERASEFAAAGWQSAQQAWDQAQAAYEKQRFGEAGSMFLTAKSRFEKARAVAKAERDDVLRETQGTQKTIGLRYQALRTALESGGSKVGAAVRKSLETACQEIDKGVEQLRSEISQGDYAAARTTANSTMRRVYEAEMKLERAGSRKRAP